ncbi:MAG: serine/threonine-protein phosphatase [Deltaproteobacteria bacterium]|nr:serine/threonine-protein phosphatase [Deltaproteobacteria bacterium]
MKGIVFSSPGPYREINEDGLLLGELIMDQDLLTPELRETGPQTLVAVADGMGGGPGGREAAFLVLTKLSELNHKPSLAVEPKLLLQNLKEAALALTMVAKRNPTLQSMGSAVAGLWLDGARALAFNCGDSRVYRNRGGFFELLTQDHSLVYELYLNGQISEEAMARHPLKNILTSCVQDNPEEPRIFIREIAIKEGDSFLLCSDGVWESASRAELEELASLGPMAGSQILATTLGKKALDNFTFVWLY